MIARMPRSLLYEMFYQSGRALGVSAYQVRGGQGTFIGPLQDQAVIRSYLMDAVWSDNILRLIFGALPDGGTFIDVGANIGLISVPVARKGAIRVISFEPDAANFALLRANAAHEGVTIDAVQAAVSDRVGEARFTKNAYNSGDHRLSDAGETTVRTLRLDDCDIAEGPLAIKIDTQGAEPLVVRGGSAMLARADLVVMEFWPWGIRRMGLDPGELVEALAAMPQRAAILRHGEALTVMTGMRAACDRLAKICESGGRFDEVDIVLAKAPDQPR
jgi:FkbM family methyltransferase